MKKIGEFWLPDVDLQIWRRFGKTRRKTIERFTGGGPKLNDLKEVLALIPAGGAAREHHLLDRIREPVTSAPATHPYRLALDVTGGEQVGKDVDAAATLFGVEEGFARRHVGHGETFENARRVGQ